MFRKIFYPFVIAFVALVLVASPVAAKNNKKTKVIKSPSSSCLLAIQAAEEGFIVTAGFVGGVKDYVSGLATAAGQASAAGGTVAATVTFIQTQTVLVQNLTAATQKASNDFTGPSQRFNTYKAECRAGR